MAKRNPGLPSQRQLRVGEEVRHALTTIMERTEFRDPALVGAPVTVTEVRVSPDLRNATVFVVPLGGGDPMPVIMGLRRVKPFLRHHLASEVRLQHVPNLSFESDESFDRAQHIEQILHSPEVQRDLVGREDDEPEKGEPLEAPAKPQ